MRPGVVWRLFLQSARMSRKRALLTIAAIAWGTVTILLLLSFGEGLKRSISRNSRALGENIAVRWMGETTKPWKGLPPGRPIRLRMDDVPFLRERLPELAGVFGEVTNWRAPLAWGDRTVSGRVVGTSSVYGEIRKHYPQPGGRFLNPRDEAVKRRVIFLGDELARDIFGAEPPVGKTLLVSGTPFTVIGVMRPKVQMGAYGGMDKDHAVIPISTYRALYGTDRINVLVVQTDEPGQMAGALRRVDEVLAARYGFDPTDSRVFPTWNTVNSTKTTHDMMLGIEVFLGVIGALTLLTGGIGVANIMYAVVKERTREIGVKMALGARRGWITGPFVLEALLYTLLGGAAGVVISLLLVTALGQVPVEGNRVLAFLGKPTLSPGIGAITAGILGAMGLLAGWFPARRAAAVDPAVTLRYE